jgi:hypothetical protein
VLGVHNLAFADGGTRWQKVLQVVLKVNKLVGVLGGGNAGLLHLDAWSEETRGDESAGCEKDEWCCVQSDSHLIP